MSDFQVALLLMGSACAGMGFFMYGKGALGRAGLIAVLAVDAAITGFLYFAQ
jgi:hypothetical protein